jgi:prolyl 4-hydroxylase
MHPALGQVAGAAPSNPSGSFNAALAPAKEENPLRGDEHRAIHRNMAAQQQVLSVNPMLAPNVIPYLDGASLTHNLIPSHLQEAATAASLNGTPGHPSALIISPVIGGIPFTVQDRPLVPPVYNGVNPNYPGLRLLYANPPIFAVDNFLTPFECMFLVNAANDAFGPAPVVGKGAGEVSPSRTSSTCYLAREDLPDYMRKVSILTGKPVEHCELPQVGRYFPTQQYLQHFDAFDLSNEDGRRFAANGGQRTVTVLVYLNDVIQGGSTAFPALGLSVQPRQGTALVFFPATVDGFLDKMALHAALPAIDTKYVSQVWIRQGEYTGYPSKRLLQTLGEPFEQSHDMNGVTPIH